MAKKTLNIVTNGNKGGLPVANQGMKLSKIIALDKIEEQEQFKELYSIDEDLLERIAEDMKSNKFDASQPVHIWLFKDENETEHFYLIDGYTRVKAAKLAGLETVPYFEHTFESFEEAHRYALHLQVDRRNLNGMDLLHNIEALMGSEYIQTMKGNKNAAMGEMLGVSEKTIERAKFVENNATEEQMEAIESGEATINSTYNELKGKKKKVEPVEEDDSDKLSVDKAYKQLKKQEKVLEQEKNSETDFSEDFNPFDDMEEISDTLEDSSGNPSPISFIQRKPAETKMTPEEDNERTRERRESYLLGLSDGFYKALVFACAEISKGRTPEEVYKDERVADLSASVIDKFELPDDAEDIVGRW